MKAYIGLLILAVAAYGCGKDEGTSGALGQVSFSAGCAGGSGSCPVSGLDSPVAVGAIVPLDFNLGINGGSGLNLTLVSADNQVLDTVGYELIGVSEGVSAVLVTTPEGAVLDFLHVWVYSPDGLRFHRVTEGGQDVGAAASGCQMLAGQEIILDVVPYAGVHRLTGNLEANWSVDASAVSLLDDGVEGRRRIVARAPGTATVVAETAGVSVNLQVEVLP